MLRIKELRENKNLTQKELATAIQTTADSIYSWEKERSQPSIEMLTRLADFFGCSIDYLAGREDDFGVIQTPSDALTQEERQLLDTFRKLNTKNRMHVAAYAEVRREEQEKSDIWGA